jgi:GDP-L-fucose synthase
MPPLKTVLILGGSGLVGSHLRSLFESKGCAESVLTPSSQDLDLTKQQQVEDYFQEYRPQQVYFLAGRVGGILANRDHPADFAYDNLAMALHVVKNSHQVNVDRLFYMGSSCIYPKLAEQPMKEEALLTGPLEETNRSYALAKIAGIELLRSFNQQFGTKYLGLMPTNLFGPGDRYDPFRSHVIPAILLKMDRAKRRGEEKLTLWGSGKVKREFLYAQDLAEALLFLGLLPDEKYLPLTKMPLPLLNVGSGEEVTIRDLAETIREIVGFKGEIAWDENQPDGTPRKLIDSSKIESLGWAPRWKLAEGLKVTYQDFLEEGIF